MSTYRSSNLLGTAIRILVIGFLAVIALRIALVVVGAAIKLSMVLVFTLGPLLLVGWIVMKGLRWFAGGSTESVA